MYNEGLNAEAPRGDIPVAVEQRVRLSFVEARKEISGEIRPEWKESAAPEDPQIRNGRGTESDDRRECETAAGCLLPDLLYGLGRDNELFGGCILKYLQGLSQMLC
jgi:hypothetical protein